MGSVLVIDDNEVEAMGRAAAFGRKGHHARSVDWAEVAVGGDPRADGRVLPDVVLAVVRRDVDSWDRYRCLVEAGDLSDLVRDGGRVVAAMTEHLAPSVTSMLRLSAHGVTEVVPVAEVATVESLDRLVGEEAAPCRPSHAAHAIAGIRIGSDPEAVIDYLDRRAAELPAVRTAFEPGLPLNRTGLSRRQALTIRRRICELGKLIPARGHDLGGPVRDTSLARWSQVVDFVNECRGYRVGDESTRAWHPGAFHHRAGGGAA